MKKILSTILTGTNDLLLVVGMMGILLVLFTPISSSVLDFLLLLNISGALLILLVTFYTEKPLEFSTFPSLLLMTTLFRLALNISATRLILDNAEAGKVIGAVGEQVVGGNYVIGLVVFLILIVVQYVVVTSGAQRVAEVAARFILDSLPGKQMSIDADLNMGIIDQEQAQKRRSELEKESNFYGAMDGASKFVKGDAIAGIIIVIIDIVGGLTIGIVQLGMSWKEALQKYTLLTVGDGIVTQIPSLVIAIATGIIITRAATDTRLGDEITRQFSAHPKTLILVAFALLGLAIIPGIPTIPILIIVCGLCVGAWFSYRRLKKRADKIGSENEAKAETSSEIDTAALYGLLKTQPFELSLGKDLSDHYLDPAEDFEQRVGILRKQLAQQLGLVLPQLSVKLSNSLHVDEYTVNIYGNKVGQGNIKPEALLAINPGGNRLALEGESTREPTYGLPAQWIPPNLRPQAHAAGYTLVEAETVLLTHIQELCRRNAAEFITRSETEKLIESRQDEFNSLVDELVPAILSYSDIQRVLQSLVTEQVPIKNLETILEVLVDAGRQIKDTDVLAEKVREKLGPIICSLYSDQDGKLHVITLASVLERKLLSTANSDGMQNGLTPAELDQFFSKAASETEKMLNGNISPVLLCAAPLRRSLKNMLSRSVPQLSILSTNEINKHPNINSRGIIDLDINQKSIA